MALHLASRIKAISAKRTDRSEPLANVDREDVIREQGSGAVAASERDVDAPNPVGGTLGGGGRRTGPDELANAQSEAVEGFASPKRALSTIGHASEESGASSTYPDRLGFVDVEAKRAPEQEQLEDVRGNRNLSSEDIDYTGRADRCGQAAAQENEAPIGNSASSGDSDAPDEETVFDGTNSIPHRTAPAQILYEEPAGQDSGPAVDFEDGLPSDIPDAFDHSIAALAFAADSATEDTLRECLVGYDWLPTGGHRPRISHGDLRGAIDALSGGCSTKLVIVDIDGVPYPAGALHEMAAVCEMGTVVIAIGSNDTAVLSRELLFAGVSDYLVKPITVAALRDAISHATAPDSDPPVAGTVAGFVGTGGSGSTTLAAAVALDAARRGRYVSVLDLNRTVPAAAVLLDVEPAAGLDQLFEVAAQGSAEQEILDSVGARRSDRIAVYAYGSNSVQPAIPEIEAVDWLVTRLSWRSQLVLVDGFDDPALCFDLLARVDARVLVVEPTPPEAKRAKRALELLGNSHPVVLVQNHTRSIKRRREVQFPGDAGLERQPDIVIPFEPSLPGIADRGWPEGRLPRSLRKPLASLTDRILALSVADEFVMSTSLRSS